MGWPKGVTKAQMEKRRLKAKQKAVKKAEKARKTKLAPPDRRGKRRAHSRLSRKSKESSRKASSSFMLARAKAGFTVSKGERVERNDRLIGVKSPSHYGANVPRTGTRIESADVIEAFGFDWNMGSAFKYMSRAGKKTVEPQAKDIRKSIWHLQRKLALMGEMPFEDVGNS